MNRFYHRCGAGMMSISDHAEIAGSFRFAATLVVMIPPAFSSAMLDAARLLWLTIFTFMAIAAAPAFALEQKVNENALVLSGEVVARDLDRIKDVFKANPAITHVVLRNSMGGKVRIFSDDYPASLTYAGFHGHYDFGKLNLAAVKTDDLVGWTMKFTDGNADPKLMQRWINIERRAGDVRFYPDAVAARYTQPTVLGQGTESARPQQCEKIATHALARGIVTTNAMYSSPDTSNLQYTFLEHKYPTTHYAALSQTDRLPVRNPLAKRDFEPFNDTRLPRAFAVSANGFNRAWSANAALAPEVALARCKAKGGGTSTGAKCVLYALNERIIYSGK